MEISARSCAGINSPKVGLDDYFLLLVNFVFLFHGQKGQRRKMQDCVRMQPSISRCSGVSAWRSEGGLEAD